MARSRSQDGNMPHKINNQSSITNAKRHCISALHPWRHKFRCCTALLWTVSWHQQPPIKCSTEGVDWMEILSTDRKEFPFSRPLQWNIWWVAEWKFSPLTGKKLSWVVCFMDCESLWLPGDCISVVEHRQLKPGALGYGWLFTFLCFTSKTYIFPSEATCSYSNQPCIWEACTENPSLELKKVKTKLYGLENYRVKHTSSVHNYFKQSCHKLKWQLWIHQQQK